VGSTERSRMVSWLVEGGGAALTGHAGNEEEEQEQGEALSTGPAVGENAVVMPDAK